jgi:hypothetical protein
MFSAGQIVAQQGAPVPQTAAVGAAPATGGYAPGPMFMQPQMLPMSGGGASFGSNIGIKCNLDSKDFGQIKPLMWGQFGLQVGQAVSNLVTTGLNYALASKSMDAQLGMAQAYYATQGKIAGYQREVAIIGLGVQDHAIVAQQSMHSEQVRHEQRMAQLTGAASARIAAIQQDGSTARAKIMATVPTAFMNARNSYSAGLPFDQQVAAANPYASFG